MGSKPMHLCTLGKYLLYTLLYIIVKMDAEKGQSLGMFLDKRVTAETIYGSEH